MKQQYRIIYLFLLLFLASSSLMSLNAQSEEQKKRFQEEKVIFFNEKLNLSEAEAELFWPVHEDFHNRQRKINEDERSLLNYYSDNSEALSENEIDETIEKFMNLQKNRVELSTQYHKTFVEIIGKRKTMKMYSLDREFRMHILKKFRSGEGERGSGGRGRPRD